MLCCTFICSWVSHLPLTQKTWKSQLSSEVHTLLITAERSLISPGNFRFKVLVNHRNYSRWNTTNMHVSSHILAIITPYSQMIMNSAKKYLHLPYKVFRKKNKAKQRNQPHKNPHHQFLPCDLPCLPLLFPLKEYTLLYLMDEGQRDSSPALFSMKCKVFRLGTLSCTAV